MESAVVLREDKRPVDPQNMPVLWSDLTEFGCLLNIHGEDPMFAVRYFRSTAKIVQACVISMKDALLFI